MAHLNDPPGPGAGMLSRKDVANEDVAKDALVEWRRCSTEADLARWARNWGEAFLIRRLGCA